MASKRTLCSQNLFKLKKATKNPDWLTQELSNCEFKDKRLDKSSVTTSEWYL